MKLHRTIQAFSRAAGVAALATAFALPAQAEEDKKAFIGGTAGLSIPSADNTEARLGWGVNGGAMLGTEYAVSGYFLNSRQEEDNQGVKFDFNYQLYGVQAAYHFEGEAKGVFLGARLGFSKVKFGLASTSPMHYGFAAGYDKMVAENFSLGGEFNYIQVQGSDDTVAGVNVPVDAFGILNFMLAAKFWF